MVLVGRVSVAIEELLPCFVIVESLRLCVSACVRVSE